MMWSLNILIPLFAIFTYGIIFLVVVFSRPQTSARKDFRAYLLCMFVWSISALLVFVDGGRVTFWFRLMMSAAFCSLLGLFHFIQTALDRHFNWSGWVYLLGGLGAVLALTTDQVVTQVVLNQGQVEYSFTPWIILVAGPGYLLCWFSLGLLYRSFRSQENQLHRNRLRYLMLGLIVIILGSLINWTPLGRYPLDIAANGFAALLLSYAILRHHLLDISVVIRKGLLYSIPTTIIGAAYFLVITLALRIFQTASTGQILLVSLVTAVVAALIAQPVRDRAQSWIDRLFFREKYDSTLMLQRMSRTAASVLDLSRLTHMILEEVTLTLHLNRAVFFLKREEGGEFLLMAQKGCDLSPTLKLGNRHPLVVNLTEREQPISNHDLGVMPQFKALWGQERADLERIGAELFIPLKSKGKLVGILALGAKLSEQEFSPDDQLTLTTLANQTAVAIENARLYSAEQLRREELESLFNLARQLVATDELYTVVDIIAKEAVKIVHATFARVILHEDEGFYCRASYPVRELGIDLCTNHLEPDLTETYYQRVIDQTETIILYRNDPSLSAAVRTALLLDVAYCICLCPLMIGENSVGVLVLGEARKASRETFDTSKLRMVHAIADQAASALQRARLHGQMEESFVQTVLALANVMDARDRYTHDHSQRLAAIAEDISRYLGCTEDDIQAVRWAAYLHDIGKMAVPDSILGKPGPLNDEEWLVMKRHPEIGAKIVAPVKRLARAVPIIHSHQEKFDGTGYPDRLAGENIPLGARILSVVDAYGAMTDDRIYRKARTHSEAIIELQRCSGTQFDPRVVKAFVYVMESKAPIHLADTTTVTKPTR